MVGTFNPFPFFLLGAKGSSLGFFWITLALLSSSSSSEVGLAAVSLESVSSRARFFPSILFLSFSSPGPDFACFSGSSAPTPKLKGRQTAVHIWVNKRRVEATLTVEGAALFLRVPFRNLSWGPKAFSWASTK